MTIEKLKSGSYRITQMEHGVRYRVTVPYKPTKGQATKLIAKEMSKHPQMTPYKAQEGAFDKCIVNFINKKEKEGKSPSTIRNYWSVYRNISEEFKRIQISSLTVDDVQNEINNYSVSRSPKSTRNLYGLIRPVIAIYRPDLVLTIKLPSNEAKAEYEPSTADIQRILQASEGSKYECAFKLGALALRRGEILAITAADLDENNVLTINKDVVETKDNKYVVKDKPKTEASYRRILIPGDVADLIRKNGRAYEGDPQGINKALHRYQKELGIPAFRFHFLRHFAAAFLHDKHFTDQQILSYGGWSNSSDVMKRVYRYNLDPERTQAGMAQAFENVMGKNVGKDL